MDQISDRLHSTFASICNFLPHHPIFLISFAIFTLAKIYCTICVIIEHFKIRNYRSKIILINGCEEKSFARRFAIKCAKNGMNVYVTCPDQQSLQTLQGTAINGKGNITAYLMDSTKNASVLEIQLKIQDELITKGKELFAIVNCPTSLTIGPDDWLSVEDYETAMQQSVFSLIRIIHAFKPMLKTSRGRIINLTNVCGKFAQPYFGSLNLSESLTEVYSDTIRRELQPFGVKVIVVQAGFSGGANKLASSFVSAWSKAPQSEKDLYGGEEYKQKVVSRLKSKENSMFHCPPECWTTSCMFNAVTSVFPRRRYIVGFSNIMFFTPMSMLPTNFQDIFFKIYSFLAWFSMIDTKRINFNHKQESVNSVASEC